MSEGEGKSLGEKENVGAGGIMSVTERIAASGQKPVAAAAPASKKRRYEEEDGKDCFGGTTLPTPAKKLKSRMMKPRLRPTPKNAIRKEPSPAPSAASSNESEDEQWVEQAVGVAFPSMADEDNEQQQTPPLLAHRRRRSNGGSLGEPGDGLQHRPQKPRIVSLDGQAHSTPPPVKIDLRTVPLRRSTSIPEFVSTAIQRKRKRRESDASSDLYDRVVSSDPPLAALSLRHPASKRVFTGHIPLSDSETSLSMVPSSSDDDPHLGQVTPHHIISPPLASRVYGRRLSTSNPKAVFVELFGDAGSDDSIPSPTSSSSSSESEVESPTKQVLLRHLMRTGS